MICEYRQHPALADPIIVSPVKGAVGRPDPARLVRVDQPEAKPVVNLVEVRADARRQHGSVATRPGRHRAAVQIAREVERHVARRRIAVLRLRFEGFQRDRLKRLRRAGRNLDREADRAGSHVGNHVVFGGTADRGNTGQQLVQDGAQGIHVGARVDRLRGVELLGRQVARRPAEMPARRVARAQAEIEEPRPQLGVEHDVRRLQVAVLHADVVRVLHGLTHLLHDPRALADLERRCQTAQLEPLDVLHDEYRRVGLVAQFVNLHDATILEEGHRTRFGEEFGQRDCLPAVAPDDLRGHETIELQVVELVDLPHPAGTEALDRAEPLELRQRRCGRDRGPADGGGQARERSRDVEIARDERRELRQQVGPIDAEFGGIGRLARDHVPLHPPREQGFRTAAHRPALSSSVRATIALASSMRHASSLRANRTPISLKPSSSSLRRTITSR